jgi:hypothetical protein
MMLGGSNSHYGRASVLESSHLDDRALNSGTICDKSYSLGLLLYESLHM